MDKEIDFYKIRDPLKEYIENQDYVPLEDYPKFLTNYKLLRLDANFLPFHITKGCLTEKDINKLLDLLIIQNKTLKYLNLSNCKITRGTILKLKNFKNLVGLNLHRTINNADTNQGLQINDESRIFENLFFYLPLKLLDISNNNLIVRPTKIILMGTLEILSMENCKFMFDSGEYMYYSKLSNLRELDISGNEVANIEIREISKLKKLKLLYCDNIIFLKHNWQQDNFTWEQYLNFLIDNVIKIKTLEYLDISVKNDPYDNYVLDKYDNLIVQKIQEMLYNLKKLKKFRCVFYSKFEPKELKINGVDVIVNEEIYNFLI